MPNRLRGEIEITIGGKPRRLVFNNNSLANIDAAFNRPCWSVLVDAAKDISKAPLHHILRVFLHGGLSEAAQGITLDAVGRAMQIDEFQHYIEQIMRGVMAAYGQDFDELAKKKETEETDPLLLAGTATETPKEQTEDPIALTSLEQDQSNVG